MNIYLFAWATPAAYLLLVTGEWLFWRRRFDKIREQVPINIFVLSLVAGMMSIMFWIETHFTICWK